MHLLRRLGMASLTLALSGCQTLSDARGGLVKAPPHCADQRVQIYFEPDSDQVTEEGHAVLRQAAIAARGCTVERVEVLGLSDAAGTPAANLELSRRRAQSVTAAVAAAGLPAADFEVAAAGQSGAVTPAGAVQPVRRRADVVVHLARPR